MTWTQEMDDELLRLKASGNTFKKIGELFNLPRTTCQDHYYKLMKKGVEWDENMDKKLEMAYQKHRDQVWVAVAGELGVSWRAAEDRAWDLGKKRFVKR